MNFKSLIYNRAMIFTAISILIYLLTTISIVFAQKPLWFRSTPDIPYIMRWSDGLLAVGTRAGHVLVYDKLGNLMWEFRTGDWVWRLDWSRDNLLAVGSRDNYVYVFDSNGNLKWKYETGDEVWSVAWSSSNLLAVGSADGFVYVFDSYGNLKWKYCVIYTAWTLDWSNNNLLAVGTYGDVYVFDETGDLRWKFGVGDWALCLDWSKDNLLAVGAWNGFIYLLDQNGEMKWRFLTGLDIWFIDWTDDGKLIAAGSDDGYVYTLDVDGNLKWMYRAGYLINYIEWSHDNKLAVVGFSKTLYVLNEDGTRDWSYLIGEVIWCVSWSDDNILACGGDGVYVFASLIRMKQPFEGFYYYINGRKYLENEVVLSPGKYNITVEEYYILGYMRYKFTKWSDGCTKRSRTVDIFGNVTLEPLFIKQYYILVTSPYSKVSGSGWYDEGSTAEIKIQDTSIDYNNGTRVIFDKWSNGLTAPTIYITVTEHTAITALWRKQYFIEVSSKFGEVSGGGWCDEGSIVTISVSTAQIWGIPYNYVFDGWYSNGQLISKSQMFTIVANKPMKVEAVWRQEINIVMIAAVAVPIIILLLVMLLKRRRVPPPPPPPGEETEIIRLR